MPCKKDVIDSYINGKKFKKAQTQHAYDYEKYKQHLEPSKKKHRQ